MNVEFRHIKGHVITGRLQALKGKIFVTDIEQGMKMLANGLILPDDNGNTAGIRPRWGRVVAVGEDVTEVEVGNHVLIEHGRWTWGVEAVIDGEAKKLHAVDPNGLLLVTPENPLAV